MDLLLVVVLSMVTGLVLVCAGLSFIDKSLDSLNFNSNWRGHNTEAYYNNPLARLNSKYWHYKPAGSVVVSKKQWEEIERNISVKIDEAKRKGHALGKRATIIQIEDLIKENQAKVFPTSPYKILNVDASTSVEDINSSYMALLKLYDPKNFVDLDPAFRELAEIRIGQIEDAWRQVSRGLKATHA